MLSVLKLTMRKIAPTGFLPGGVSAPPPYTFIGTEGIFLHFSLVHKWQMRLTCIYIILDTSDVIYPFRTFNWSFLFLLCII